MQVYSIRKALNIPEYKITKIISATDKEIHIKLEPYKRRPFVCSGCSQVHKIGQHGLEESVVEDLPMFEKRVYITVVKRRYKCPIDKRTHIEEISWLKKYTRITKRFAGKINRLTAITTNQEAGWFLGLNDEVVYRIDKEVLQEQYAKRLEPTPTSLNISIDEVAWKKHHRYLTNVIDTDKKVVTWNAKGRKAKVLNRYYESLGNNGCRAIESAAMDGARTYISSTKKYAVNALIVLDRFHATQKVNKTTDQVRRDELSKARKNENEELIALTNCRQRFILLKNKKNLSDRQSVTLKKLCDVNQAIYKAMLLKESFLQTYECKNIDDAKDHIVDWVDQAFFSGLQPFIELAYSVIDKMKYILNWFKKKISSAISEGFNNKIKRLKRMAYGYKDIDYFKLKIHQHCGYLNPRRFHIN